jgi:NTE family protein
MTYDQRRVVPRVQWLRKLASRGRNRTALVLSGGGPYGALQAGALRAVLEAGIQPEIVVGTSAGALNGAFIAKDPTPAGARTLEDVWRSISDEDLFPGVKRRSAWARMLMRGNRIFDNSGLAGIIGSRLGIETFEEAQVPLGVVATDMELGRDEVFDSGPLLQPLLASSAMPGIFPPVEIGGRLFIDGGVTNAVPIGPAVAMGANKIYVLNCSGSQQERRPLQRPMDYLLHAFLLARSQRLEMDLPRYSEQAEIIMLPAPTLGFSVPFTSIQHTETMLAMGYKATRRLLEDRGAETFVSGGGEAT